MILFVKLTIWCHAKFLCPSRIHASEPIIKKMYLKIELVLIKILEFYVNMLHKLSIQFWFVSDSFGYISVIMSILFKTFFSADAVNNTGQCFKLIQIDDSNYSLCL